MKTMRKMLSLLLVVAMIACMSVTAFAAEGYTITIHNATVGHTYEAYQIFTGDLSGKVLSNIKWGTGITAEGQKALVAHYQLDESATARQVAEALAKKNDAAAFAEIAGKYLTTATAQSVKGEGVYTISGLAAGYYLVKDGAVTGNDASSSYIVEVVENSEVNPKSSVPEVEKKVKDTNDTTGETTGWQDSADYDIGDNVPFKLTATLGNNLTGYDTYKVVFHDTLSAGLTFNNDVVVTINGKKIESGYTVANENGKITVTLNDVLALGAHANSVITVEYTAKLNENAVIGNNGNPNEVYLEFSNNPNGEGTGTTPSDKVVVFTFKLIVNKVDEKHEALQGAGFTLYKKDAQGEYQPVGKEIKGDALTTFEWKGLDDGDYKLVETTVPAGYNKMADIEFTITAEHDIESADPRLISVNASKGLTLTAENGVLTTEIVNQAGSTLPETGGMGTTLFYALGGFLAVAAVVLLVTKKKMSSAR